MFLSKIGPGYGEPGGTPTPRIAKSTPPGWNRSMQPFDQACSSTFLVLIYTKIRLHFASVYPSGHCINQLHGLDPKSEKKELKKYTPS